jgi:outer membrane lipoprotein carrier protein
VFRVAALWVIVSMISQAEPATSDQLIRDIESRYNRARTLSVQFVENYEVMGHARPPESGTLTLRKQGKMRWDYNRPKGKLVISDGKTVYLYTSGDNRVEKMPVRDTEDMRAPLAFLLGHLDLRKEFRDFTVQPGDGGDWLGATAKNDRVPYERVQMLIGAQGVIGQLKVLGRDGSTVGFVFSGEQLNPAVANALFRFTVPPGAQLVDGIELGGEGK